MKDLFIAGKLFQSRLFLGTGKFASNKVMQESIVASGSQLVTVALKRLHLGETDDEMVKSITLAGVALLPNTSGARTAKEAVLAAKLGREALDTNWVKLEIHPDPRYLLPDCRETVLAAEELSRDGFVVLPYINADPVTCKHLEQAGAAAVMPLGSPIGSNHGLETRGMLRIIIEQASVPVIIDAGIGAPSHAAEAMEMGADAVLVNTAIAVAEDPVRIARAFRLAVEAGRMSYESGPPQSSLTAHATSPLTSFLNEES